MMLAPALTRSSLREAMLARRFYAIRRAGIDLEFEIDGAGIGSRLGVPAGEPLDFHASTSAPGATLERSRAAARSQPVELRRS